MYIQTGFKIYMKRQMTYNCQNNFKMKNKVVEITVLDFKSSFKAIVITGHQGVKRNEHQ